MTFTLGSWQSICHGQPTAIELWPSSTLLHVDCASSPRIAHAHEVPSLVIARQRRRRAASQTPYGPTSSRQWPQARRFVTLMKVRKQRSDRASFRNLTIAEPEFDEIVPLFFFQQIASVCRLSNMSSTDLRSRFALDSHWNRRIERSYTAESNLA